MINRLVYEVRLKKTEASPRWRWDVKYYITTDPEYPGVETGRKHVGQEFGYERFKWQALSKIGKCIGNNSHKTRYVEL